MINNYEEILKKGKWKYTFKKPDLAVVDFKGNQVECEVLIQGDKDGITFGVMPYISTTNILCINRLYGILLLLNYKINYAKFCINDDKQVSLLLETANPNISIEEFENYLQMICLLSDKFYEILYTIANDPDFKIPVQFEKGEI